VICPNCGAEYQPGVRNCADCQVELVEPGSGRGAAVERPGGSVSGRVIVRWLLVAVLCVFVVLRLIGTWLSLNVDNASAAYYASVLLTDVAPAVAAAVAIVLALRGLGGRVAWGVLCACGLALLALGLVAAAGGAGFSTALVEGAALAGLSVLQFPRSGRLAGAAL
jgi:hypothetical protein